MYGKEKALDICVHHYEQPHLLDYLWESNAGAELYLFNSKAVGAVAKKLGFGGRKAGSQLTNQLIHFFRSPFKVNGCSEDDAITASVNDKKNVVFVSGVHRSTPGCCGHLSGVG